MLSFAKCQMQNKLCTSVSRDAPPLKIFGALYTPMLSTGGAHAHNGLIVLVIEHTGLLRCNKLTLKRIVSSYICDS